MLEPLPHTPAGLPENPLPQLLEEVFFAPLREVMEGGLKVRSCKVRAVLRGSPLSPPRRS